MGTFSDLAVIVLLLPAHGVRWAPGRRLMAGAGCSLGSRPVILLDAGVLGVRIVVRLPVARLGATASSPATVVVAFFALGAVSSCRCWLGFDGPMPVSLVPAWIAIIAGASTTIGTQITAVCHHGSSSVRWPSAAPRSWAGLRGTGRTHAAPPSALPGSWLMAEGLLPAWNFLVFCCTRPGFCGTPAIVLATSSRVIAARPEISGASGAVARPAV